MLTILSDKSIHQEEGKASAHSTMKTVYQYQPHQAIKLIRSSWYVQPSDMKLWHFYPPRSHSGTNSTTKTSCNILSMCALFYLYHIYFVVDTDHRPWLDMSISHTKENPMSCLLNLGFSNLKTVPSARNNQPPFYSLSCQGSSASVHLGKIVHLEDFRNEYAQKYFQESTS